MNKQDRIDTRNQMWRVKQTLEQLDLLRNQLLENLSVLELKIKPTPNTDGQCTFEDGMLSACWATDGFFYVGYVESYPAYWHGELKPSQVFYLAQERDAFNVNGRELQNLGGGWAWNENSNDSK